MNRKNVPVSSVGRRSFLAVSLGVAVTLLFIVIYAEFQGMVIA